MPDFCDGITYIIHLNLYQSLLVHILVQVNSRRKIYLELCPMLTVNSRAQSSRVRFSKQPWMNVSLNFAIGVADVFVFIGKVLVYKHNAYKQPTDLWEVNKLRVIHYLEDFLLLV